MTNEQIQQYQNQQILNELREIKQNQTYQRNTNNRIINCFDYGFQVMCF